MLTMRFAIDARAPRRHGGRAAPAHPASAVYRKGVAGVHLCLADEAVSNIVTAERKARTDDATAVPSWVLLIEGISQADVNGAADDIAPTLAAHEARNARARRLPAGIHPPQDALGCRMTSLVAPIEYDDASPEVRAVYDDIMATRRVPSVNNFWKVLAHDPANLARVWGQVKSVMAEGALDPLVKEMLYIAVSVTNNCEYCIHSHTASRAARA